MAKKKGGKLCRIKTKNPCYCGIGAGGVQFANGQAVIPAGWIAEWYREHGYTVEEVAEVEETTPTNPPDGGGTTPPEGANPGE